MKKTKKAFPPLFGPCSACVLGSPVSQLSRVLCRSVQMALRNHGCRIQPPAPVIMVRSACKKNTREIPTSSRCQAFGENTRKRKITHSRESSTLCQAESRQWHFHVLADPFPLNFRTLFFRKNSNRKEEKRFRPNEIPNRGN